MYIILCIAASNYSIAEYGLQACAHHAHWHKLNNNNNMYIAACDDEIKNSLQVHNHI